MGPEDPDGETKRETEWAGSLTGGGALQDPSDLIYGVSPHVGLASEDGPSSTGLGKILPARSCSVSRSRVFVRASVSGSSLGTSHSQRCVLATSVVQPRCVTITGVPAARLSKNFPAKFVASTGRSANETTERPAAQNRDKTSRYGRDRWRRLRGGLQK